MNSEHEKLKNQPPENLPGSEVAVDLRLESELADTQDVSVEHVQDSHIARILEDDEFGKRFDQAPDALNKKASTTSYFADLFTPHEWRFITWSSGIFVLCIFAFSSVESLFSAFSSPATPAVVSTSTQTTDANTNTEASNAQGVSSNNASYVRPGGTAVELPSRIEIPKVGINIEVRNPSSTDYKVLDTELTKGAVRYPGSGYPGKGNMLLFGHSTGYKVVRNQAYKAFNDIKTLVEGDSIFIHTGTQTYEYRVTSVKKVNKYDTKITFEGAGDMITLSTCDSFGTKSDRYVVEATLVR